MNNLFIYIVIGFHVNIIESLWDLHLNILVFITVYILYNIVAPMRISWIVWWKIELS